MVIRLIAAIVIGVSASSLLAQAPWQGTWKLVESESHYAIESLMVERGPDGSLTVRNDGRPPVHFLPDRRPHKDAATGLDYFASAEGSYGFMCRISRGDAQVLDIEASFRSDPKTLTESITEYRQNGADFHRSVDYTRVSGSGGFVGTWQATNPDTGGPPQSVSVRVVADGTFHLSLPDFSLFITVKPGGPAGSIMSPKLPTANKVTLAREGGNTLHWTMSSYQKVVVAGTAALSSDGRTVRIEAWPSNRPEARSVAVYTRQP